MKKGVFIIIGMLVLVACNTQDKEQKSKNETVQKQPEKKLLKPEELIYDNGGTYLERYPTGETKVEGQKTQDGLRTGVWKAFSQDGTPQSICTYSEGKKHGISMVYHPNGNVSYQGEYDYDKRVGEWKFFNSAGTLVKTEKFD